MATTKLNNLIAKIPRTRGRLRLWRRQIFFFFAVIGPGLITSNVDNDAGGIYTYSQAGAQFGYLLLWTIIPMTIILFITEEMAARLGVFTGKGLSDLIREEFGFRVTFFLMGAVLVVAMGNVLAEFAGVAASLELFGISKYFSVPIAAFLVWVLVIKGTYKVVEKIFLVACLFYLSYLFSAFLAEPDWMEAAYYTVTPTINWHPSYLLLLLALIGSTIAPWQHFYLQASVVEKGVPKERYWETRMDVLLGSITCMAVVFFIIVSAAATLHANGITQIKDAAAAAAALEPFAGPYASTLFAFGLLNASLFAATILPLSTAYVICEGLGVESGLDKEFREAPFFYWLYTALIVVGAGLILLPGMPLVRIMVLSQAVNAILLPAVLVFMLLLINRTDLMGTACNSRLANFITWGTVIVVSGLTLLLVIMALFDVPGASQLPPG